MLISSFDLLCLLAPLFQEYGYHLSSVEDGVGIFTFQAKGDECASGRLYPQFVLQAFVDLRKYATA
jgi:hypothetical protein